MLFCLYLEFLFSLRFGPVIIVLISFVLFSFKVAWSYRILLPERSLKFFSFILRQEKDIDLKQSWVKIQTLSVTNCGMLYVTNFFELWSPHYSYGIVNVFPEWLLEGWTLLWILVEYIKKAPKIDGFFIETGKLTLE